MTPLAHSLGFDLRVLETFAVLGDELNYRRAAELLYVSQPAVSQQIKKLERQLGFALLERTSSGVRLTETGAVFHEATGRALRILRESIRPIRETLEANAQRLRIGYITTWARTQIPQLTARIERESPQLKVVLESYVFDELIHAINEQEVDLAIFHLPDVLDLDTSRLQLARVGSSQRLIAVPREHPFADRDMVSIEELADETWVGATGIYAENFVALCKDRGFTPRIAVNAANAETMLGLVRAGLGITVVPNMPAGWDDLSFVPIDDEILDIVAAQNRDALSPFAPQVINHIREMLSPVPAAAQPGGSAMPTA